MSTACASIAASRLSISMKLDSALLTGGSLQFRAIGAEQRAGLAELAVRMHVDGLDGLAGDLDRQRLAGGILRPRGMEQAAAAEYNSARQRRAARFQEISTCAHDFPFPGFLSARCLIGQELVATFPRHSRNGCSSSERKTCRRKRARRSCGVRAAQSVQTGLMPALGQRRRAMPARHWRWACVEIAEFQDAVRAACSHLQAAGRPLDRADAFAMSACNSIGPVRVAPPATRFRIAAEGSHVPSRDVTSLHPDS